MICLARVKDLQRLSNLDAGSSLTAWSQSDLLEWIRGKGLIWVLLERDIPLAYAVFQIVGVEAELLRMAVGRKHRRLGIGRRLLKACLEELRIRDCHECFLEVREGNQAALALYLGLGFTVVGHRTDYYRDPNEDAIVMRLHMVEREKEKR